MAPAFPLFPRITGHDFNFGAVNLPDGPVEWATNGAAPDTLTYIPSPTHHEVTAYWPTWPAPPVFPVFDVPGGIFGGDFFLDVRFTGQDAPYVGTTTIDVSLTGTGNNPGPDLMIFGSVPGMGFAGLLWAIELDTVSLYGYSTHPSYVLEGGGTIVDGIVAREFNLIGQTGVMRGNIDFFEPPVMLPALYDPMVAYSNLPSQWRAAYSGETGKGYVAPEPGTLVVAGLAALALRRRRR